MSKNCHAVNRPPSRIRVRSSGVSAARLRDNPDVDKTVLEDGSVIVYNSSRNIFETTTTLNAQNIEGGEY